MSDYQIKFTNNYDPVNNPNGVEPITVREESVDTSTDIVLFGRERLAYGQQMNQNMLSLLEHFACPENPILPGTPDLSRSSGKLQNPVIGQFWYNETQRIPFVWDGTAWLSLHSGGSIASNWGIISNGQQLPQPVGDDGYVFPYSECVWVVSPFAIDGEILDYIIETDDEATVTATFNSGQSLVVNYMIVGIRGNTNIGTTQPVITPTPTPTTSITPSRTSMAMNLTNGLVSFWEFEESATGPFLDSVGANNFQIEGSAPGSVAGVVGNAIQASSSTVLNTNSLIVGSNNYSFGGWFKINSGFTGYSNLFQRGTFGLIGQRSFTLTYTLGTDSLSLYKSNDGTSFEFVTTTSNIGLDDFDWHLVIAWVDVSAMTLNIQIDNGIVYSSPFIFPATYDIGTFKLGSSTGIPLQAAVDQLFYYNRVLNSAERAALWNNGDGVSSAFASGLVTPTPTPTPTVTNTPSATPNLSPLSVVVDTYNATGSCFGAGCSTTTNTVYATISGGIGPYSYLWVHVGGDTATPTISNGPYTAFSRTGTADVAVGYYRLRVTDTTTGVVVYSPVVSVTTTHA